MSFKAIGNLMLSNFYTLLKCRYDYVRIGLFPTGFGCSAATILHKRQNSSLFWMFKTLQVILMIFGI